MYKVLDLAEVIQLKSHLGWDLLARQKKKERIFRCEDSAVEVVEAERRKAGGLLRSSCLACVTLKSQSIFGTARGEQERSLGEVTKELSSMDR